MIDIFLSHTGDYGDGDDGGDGGDGDDGGDGGDGGDDDDGGDCVCWQPALDISSFSLTRLIGRASLDHD